MHGFDSDEELYIKSSSHILLLSLKISQNFELYTICKYLNYVFASHILEFSFLLGL